LKKEGQGGFKVFASNTAVNPPRSPFFKVGSCFASHNVPSAIDLPLEGEI